QVWKLERDHPDHDQMAFSRKPYVTWYGWDGDRLVTEQTQQTRIQTLYTPGSFTPLIRIETDVAELAKAHHRSLAEKLQQEGSENGQPVMMPPVLIQMLDKLEAELRHNAVSEENRRWLAGCGLTVERMAAQLEPIYEPNRAIHLYHCDHRGLPLALVDSEGNIVWQAEYNEWGSQLSENNPHSITQNFRLPGQQYDEESGLHYNRHRYYEPLMGRYITQDPIGLEGGLNPYQYPLNPVKNIDPLGLAGLASFGDGMRQYCQQAGSAVNYLSTDEAAGVIHNMETMHNVPNPLSEYVLGVSVGSAIIGLGGMNFGSATVAEKSSACIKDVADAVIKDGEREPKNLLLTCGKSFINEGGSDHQGKTLDYLTDILSSYEQKQ
ncbi:RHS repeat-associated core domain-containing protein, partial [Kluyvera sp. NPDC087067]|uniref:RHS repeat-associated core domain-containing protein n=1 Tax=Kluyvera sp. NPDC087067 TaxID=3364105 RepID=UPI00382E1079